MSKQYYWIIIIAIMIALVNPAKVEAAKLPFPMNNMVKLMDVRFKGKKLKDRYFESLPYSYWSIHCKAARVVVNFPPDDGEVTTVVGATVWFDGLAFMSEEFNNPGSNDIYVSNDISCVFTSNTPVIETWMTKYRFIAEVPYYPRDPRDFYYYVSINNFAPIWSSFVSGTGWCRSRSAGSYTQGTFYKNVVFNTPNNEITYVSIDFQCTEDIKVLKRWLKEGWVKRILPT